ncbi:hypothetical protein ACFX10_003359 [Malus domestica]
MKSFKSSIRRSSRCSTRLDILKHTSSSPMWKSTINWVPPQHGGPFALDMGILVEKRATHRNGDQHETSLNPVDLNRSRRSGGRHLLTEGVE